MRPYKLKLFNYNKLLIDQNYDTLKEIIIVLKIILTNMNLLSFIDKGEFIESHFNKQKYFKKFKISIDVPNIKIIIIKRTAGSINKELFLEELKREV